MSRFIALLPAAGAGSRMGSTTPKQYLPLLGQPLLMHTLAALAAVPEIDRLVLVLSPQDEWFDAYTPNPAVAAKLTVVRCGGASRAESVRNGLAAIADQVSRSDWVLVHDAARPCLAAPDVSRMIATLRDDTVGGILALPVADTLKRAASGERIAATVNRDALWRAQTPQMFRHGLLSDALAQAASDAITDEASAVERLGHAPRLVPGNERNIKVTYPEDLALAALFLQSRQELAA
ncbi:2-C-methyl-D-erythritol 4-phosphate cytidylyltransferase [Chitinimonas sp. BJYL2]|uniref:2-C-methyl-D-erythritol 4-phosphate cytidylyltransferase n=1 Tax=Chitinimonas sp. BJYL2 TaxID=2976696 RepID=UPI0022B4390C|nr:2-C-methyl-D-erythritol 4-phosphate cytidylyltransferase [Chitinimonas sp. BJYL2]